MRVNQRLPQWSCRGTDVRRGFRKLVCLGPDRLCSRRGYVEKSHFRASFRGATPRHVREARAQVEIVDAGAGTEVAAGLAGGIITAAMMAIDHVFAATTRDQRWAIFGQLMNKEPYTFAMRKDVADAKGITANAPFAERLKALEGTTIAISSLDSGTQLALASAMASAGVSPEKVRWVPIGEPLAIVTAIERKQVDVGGRAPGPAEMRATLKIFHKG